MKRKTVSGIMLTLLLIGMLSIMLNIAPVSAQPIQELAYDDGGDEAGVSPAAGVVGPQYAVRFSLPIGWTTAKILTAKYYIWYNPASFKVCIYDSDGMVELTTPFAVTPTTTGWFEVDLTGLNIIVSNDFYIAIEWTSPQKPILGIDESSPDLRTYSRSSSTESWTLDETYDNMIRAVVTVDTAPPNITDVSQTPLENNVLPEDEVKVNATVTDELSGVKQVVLNYTNGNGTWIAVGMTNLEGNVWNATIPKFPYCTNVTYAIIAEDNANNTITTEEMGYEYKYHVIPEFPTWTSMLLILIVLTVAIAIYKRRLLKTPIH